MNVKKILARLEEIAQLALGHELDSIPERQMSSEDADIVYRGSLLTVKQVGSPYLQSHVAEWFALGMLAHHLKWYSIAERYYRMVTAVTPTHADAWFHLGLLFDDQGLWQMAREIFTTALQVAPPNWVRGALVEKRIRRGGAQKVASAAAGRLGNVASLAPELPKPAEPSLPQAANHQPAAMGEKLCPTCGRPIEGLPYSCQYCDLAFCVDHRLPEAHLCDGPFRAEKGSPRLLPTSLEEAMRALDGRLNTLVANMAWVVIDPFRITEDDERLLARIADLIAPLLKDKSSLPGSHDFWFRAGKLAHRLGWASRAEFFYNAALGFLPAPQNSTVPQNIARAETLAYLGQVLQLQLKGKEAKSAFQSARALAPDRAERWIMSDTAGTMLEMGPSQGFLTSRPHSSFTPRYSEGEYRKQLTQNPGDGHASFALAHFAWENGQLGEAEKYFQAGLKLQPDTPTMWNSLGCVLVEEGKLRPAEDAFRTGIYHNPHDANPHYNLGLLLACSNRYGPAVEEFRTCTGLTPQDARPWVQMGLLLQKLGRLEDAGGAFRHATRLEPWLETILPRLTYFSTKPRRNRDPGNLYT